MAKAFFRTGRHLGTTIYLQLGIEPSDGDPLIGHFNEPRIADMAVVALNDAQFDVVAFLRRASIGAQVRRDELDGHLYEQGIRALNRGTDG